jgi:hypothetical protein
MQNVCIAGAMYMRLANRRVVIRGKCSRCGCDLIKASIMPKSAAIIFRKKRRGKRTFPII